MKFEIEISEKIIQSRLDYLTNFEGKYGSPSFDLRKIIDTAVLEAIKVKLLESFKVTEAVDRIIQIELEKAAVLKVPGWAKRRLKELLEAARLLKI